MSNWYGLLNELIIETVSIIEVKTYFIELVCHFVINYEVLYAALSQVSIKN